VKIGCPSLCNKRIQIINRLSQLKAENDNLEMFPQTLTYYHDELWYLEIQPYIKNRVKSLNSSEKSILSVYIQFSRFLHRKVETTGNYS